MITRNYTVPEGFENAGETITVILTPEQAKLFKDIADK